MRVLHDRRGIRSRTVRTLRGAGFGMAAIAVAAGLPLGFTLTWAATEPTSFRDTLLSALDAVDPVAPLLEDTRLRRIDRNPAFDAFPDPASLARYNPSAPSRGGAVNRAAETELAVAEGQ